MGAVDRLSHFGDGHGSAGMEPEPEQFHDEALFEPVDLLLGVDPGDIGVHRRLEQAQGPPEALPVAAPLSYDAR